MVRRKVPRHVPQAPSPSAHSPTAKEHVSARDYYNRRYEEVDKKRRCTGLYEDFTESHMNRMKGLWREYVNCPSLLLSWGCMRIPECMLIDQGRGGGQVTMENRGPRLHMFSSAAR